MSYPIPSFPLLHSAASSGAAGAPLNADFRDTFHIVNDAAFIASGCSRFSVRFRVCDTQNVSPVLADFHPYELRYCAGDDGHKLSGILDKVSRASGLSFAP